MNEELMSWSELKSLRDAVYNKHLMKNVRVDEGAAGPDAPQKLVICRGEKKAEICKVVKLAKDILSVDVLVFDTPEAMIVKLMVYGIDGHIYSVAVESVYLNGSYDVMEGCWDIPGFTS